MSVQTQIDRISGAVSAALTALSEKGVTVPTGTKVDDLAALISGIEAGGGDENKVTGNITPAAATKTLTITHGLGKIPKYFCIIKTKYFGLSANASAKVETGGTVMQDMLGIVFAGGRSIAVYPGYSAGPYARMSVGDDTSDKYVISDINEQTISFDVTFYSTCQFEATKHCWEAM